MLVEGIQTERFCVDVPAPDAAGAVRLFQSLYPRAGVLTVDGRDFLETCAECGHPVLSGDCWVKQSGLAGMASFARSYHATCFAEVQKKRAGHGD